MENIAKVNVLIVTYKQQDLIGRNIESIIKQKEHGLNQIIICDDNSPDNNWEVICSYVNKYPEYITAYRNEANLGIYGNSDKCASLHGDADLFCWIEGDDAMCDGALERLQNFIAKNDIDLAQPCGICCDWVSVNPDGKQSVHSNKVAVSGYNYLGLKWQGYLTWRGSFFTKKVIEQFTPTILNQGLALAEGIFDAQWFMYSKILYYCPGSATKYYTMIGVSIGLGEESDFQGRESEIKWKYFLDNELYAGRKEKHWLLFLVNKAQCQYNPSFLRIISADFHFLLGNYWRLNKSLRPLLSFNAHSLKRMF